MHFLPGRIFAALLASASAGTLVAATPFARPAQPNALAARDSASGVGGTVQLPGLTLPDGADADKQTIVDMFTSAYQTYKKYAFGHDDLQPVSLTFNDGRNGWGASIVDGMATMFIMGLEDDFNQAVEFASNINFNESQVVETVSLFETTIRYVGGLLVSYQLSGNQHQILVDKAKEVTDKMAFAWVGSNDLPFGEMNFTTNQPVVATTNIAEAGTLTMEWSTLSRLTGNDTYRNLTEKSVRHIASLADPFPGLAPQCIDPSTGQFDCELLTWGGGSDSYFEYLLKYPILTGTTDPTFIDTWRLAVDSSIKLLKQVSTVGNHTYLADWNGQIDHVGSHLACFMGGNWLLGGKVLENDTIVDIALELVDACWNTYQSTFTGIGPETFAFISPGPNGSFTGSTPPDEAQLAFYNEHGFYITEADYILRPEVLESNFYAWRVTGDTKYVDRARQAAQSIQNFTSVNGAYAGINNVSEANSGFVDDLESFFFAELMKYLFLTFDDPEHISLDTYVFNTEGQPFLREAPLGTTGTLAQEMPFAPPGSTPVSVVSETVAGPFATVSAIPAVGKPLATGVATITAAL